MWWSVTKLLSMAPRVRTTKFLLCATLDKQTRRLSLLTRLISSRLTRFSTVQSEVEVQVSNQDDFRRVSEEIGHGAFCTGEERRMIM